MKKKKADDNAVSEDIKEILNILCSSSFYTYDEEYQMIISFLVDPERREGDVQEQRQPFQRQMCGSQIEAINALKQLDDYRTISPYDLQFTILYHSIHNEEDEEDFEEDFDFDFEEDFEEDEK